MHELQIRSQPPAPLPPARKGGSLAIDGGAIVRIRPGAPADLAFIDALQKKHGKQLGFMNRPTLEGKIALGHVLVAEEAGGGQQAAGREDTAISLPPAAGRQPPALLGYLIGNDRYRHRDELGVIFQMCVVPAFRRSLVAAHLLKAQFERSTYGCKLYCCWCAQDIEANRFWESMGFVPIAFRAGSEKRNRVHIFWQRRNRDGDTETPWWFPSETVGGMMDTSRIALPIPPGMHWSDELPRLIPTAAATDAGEPVAAKRISSSKRTKPAEKPAAPPEPVIVGIRSGGLRLTPDVFEPVAPAAEQKSVAIVKPEKPKRVKKASPELAAKARDLQDRWMQAAGRGEGVALPAPKYDISRLVAGANSLAGPRVVIEDVRSLGLPGPGPTGYNGEDRLPRLSAA